PRSMLTVGYWFTVDGGAMTNYVCDSTAMTALRVNVTNRVSAVSPPRSMADTFVEIGFMSGAPTLAASNGDSGEIKGRIFNGEQPNFTQTNDYSFDPTKADYVDWTHMTLYKGGMLVWGTEP